MVAKPAGVFTVDVEDYFQVSAFEAYVPRDRWDEYSSRVVNNTRKILALLRDQGIHGTFFVLGWVAEKHPELVREIDADGHELASHSYWHRLIYQLTPDEFREDLRRSKQVLENIIGRSVTAFRAPSFSITKQSLWAINILIEEGFTTDSSVFPIYHDRCGIPNAKPRVHRLKTDVGELTEFPPTVATYLGWNLPVGGGGYFRLYPTRLTMSGMRRAEKANGHPAMFYIHPWEVDPEQPRLGVGSRASRFRHYVGLKSTHRKLELMMGRFRFTSMQQALEDFPPTETVEPETE